ncbi:hypothetical protein HRI_003512700 [Hibiscus trionum]|uniref:Uncharacterized protein n=1 Tax=Hibiscus trionum TaxID=183268 RepID=A0A9W7MFR1_HIBTR|nr:hypothetical protein HRI_003512700 [Hibiscus trionum]
MERKEKSVGSEGENQDLMVKKLKGGIVVGKRADPSTPSPTWRLEFSSQNGTTLEFLYLPTGHSISSRKLCANLWELHPHYPLPSMRKGAAKLRLHNFKEKGFDDVVHLPHTPLDQIAAYKPAIARPTLDFKGRSEPSGYSLKTSTELLKVLNRICALEEHHVSNMSLVNALKVDLYHSRGRIKELLPEKQAERQGIDNLMKQVMEDKLVKKDKEQDRIKADVQPLKVELENERRLRKRSESMHRKLARELSEVRSSFANALKELERERKARVLLENLHEIDYVDGEKPERLILHISESWLDERMQMKLAEGKTDLAEKNSIVNKLSLDIETFLEAKRSTSAPQGAVDEEYSSDSDSECYEPKKTANRLQSNGSCKLHRDNPLVCHCEELGNRISTRRKAQSQDAIKGSKSRSFRGRFDEQMSTGEPIHDNKVKPSGCHRLSSSNVLDSLIRNHYLSSEGDEVHPECSLREESCVQSLLKGRTSPVGQSVSNPGFKEYTLKEKLLEARLEGHRSRAKATKGMM